jgi:lipopolysaccharide transport system permease protein
VAGNPQGLAGIIRPHPRVPDLAGLLLAYRLFIHRAVLIAVTRVELAKRYAGSYLGLVWYPLYWAVLLGMYCFVYVVIFRQRIPEFGQFGYVLFIFAGLIPYFGLSDAVASGTSSVRANMAFHRNAVFPIELVPIQAVLVALGSQAVAVGIVVVLASAGGFAGWHFLYLPIPFVLQFLLIAGLVSILAAVNVLVPDVQHVVSLALWLFLFLSPIGFAVTQVPPGYRWLMWLNPLTYLIEEFRFAILGIRTFDAAWSASALAGLSAVSFLVGAMVFRRLMIAFGDYE